MNIAEARAYTNGIDFYIHSKNITIQARRNLDGNIVITQKNEVNQFEKIRQTPILKLAILIISILASLFFNYCNNYKIEIIAIMIFVWSCTFAYYFINYKNQKKSILFRYHAAEHKVLNYIDKYGEVSQDYNKIMKMPSFSIRCGSTIIAVIYVLVSLLAIGIILIPGFIFKILWCIFSIFITLYLWANEKLYFFQKFVLKDPSYKEVEVAICGFIEFLEMKV